MLVSSVSKRFPKESALKRFISRFKKYIKRETALPRLQALKKKIAHTRKSEIMIKIGGGDENDYFFCILHFKYGNDASKFDLA